MICTFILTIHFIGEQVFIWAVPGVGLDSMIIITHLITAIISIMTTILPIHMVGVIIVPIIMAPTIQDTTMVIIMGIIMDTIIMTMAAEHITVTAHPALQCRLMVLQDMKELQPENRIAPMIQGIEAVAPQEQPDREMQKLFPEHHQEMFALQQELQVRV